MPRSLISICALFIILILNINLNLVNAASPYVDNKTGVIIDKEIKGDLLSQQLQYTIITPKLDDFDFVLAVDSSGSLGPKENYLEGSAIVKAIPAFVKGIADNYSRTEQANFNISLVSWNDKIQFASSPNNFMNANPSKAKLFLVNKSINDIDSFVNNFKQYYNCSDETTGTNISNAILASINVLDADTKPPIDYRKTRKFIILVAGKGEFEPCSRVLMNEAKKKGYEIFTIGLDVPPSSYLFSHLKDLTMNKDIHWRFIGASPNSLQGSLDQSLEVALRDALDNATKSEVAKNIRIVESVYSYYKPDLSSFIIDGIPVNQALIQSKTNPDGTTTIILDMPEGIRPNSKKIVSFKANFDPGYLPVTITNSRKPIILCSPDASTPLPEIRYNWFNGESFKVDLI
jgi:hypothetical protein